MTQPKTAKLGAQFFWGIFSFCLVALLVNFAVSRGLFSRPDSYEEKRAANRAEKLAALRKDEETKLTTYGWADKAKGVVHVPVDRGVTLALNDLKAKAVVPSSVTAEPNVSNLVPPYVKAQADASTAAGQPAPTASAK